MPWQKGNKSATVNKGKPKRKEMVWEHMGDWMVTMGAEAYLDKMKALMDEDDGGGEYMDRFEGILEYFKPKQQRTTLVGDPEQPLALKMEDLFKSISDARKQSGGDKKHNQKAL